MGYTHYTRGELSVIRREVKSYINATPGWRNAAKSYKKRGYVKVAAQELGRPLNGVWTLFNDMVKQYAQKTRPAVKRKTAYSGLPKQPERIKLVKAALVAAGLTPEAVENAFNAKPAKLPKEFFEHVNARVSRRETFSVRISYNPADGGVTWAFNPVVVDELMSREPAHV